MTVEQFRPFSQTHQALFHEIFTIQRRMRKRTLGIRHWHFITKRKIELSKGYFVQTSEVLLLVSVCMWSFYLNGLHGSPAAQIVLHTNTSLLCSVLVTYSCPLSTEEAA